MIVCIIAGGSGTRLWPLSTPDYPKHLLKLTGRSSLLRYTYERASKIADTVYVIPEEGHAHHVKEQLSELPENAFIVEPARRGTASCIVAALNHIRTQHKDPSEPIAFLSADHYIRDTAGFIHSFGVAEEVARKNGHIVLIGIEPDHPATGFGYIKKGEVFDKEKFVFNVIGFKEKPDYEVAKEYVNSGNYVWNCGYFVASLNTFVANMRKHAPDLLANYESLAAVKNPQEYKDTYLGFSNNSIDYALIEKVKELVVVPAAFDWMDLGSYPDLHKAVDRDQCGNHVRGLVELEGVENSFIQNDQDVPVAVIGLDNVVVVNTPNGILVARKDLAQKVGEVSKRFKPKEVK